MGLGYILGIVSRGMYGGSVPRLPSYMVFLVALVIGSIVGMLWTRSVQPALLTVTETQIHTLTYTTTMYTTRSVTITTTTIEYYPSMITTTVTTTPIVRIPMPVVIQGRGGYNSTTCQTHDTKLEMWVFWRFIDDREVMDKLAVRIESLCREDDECSKVLSILRGNETKPVIIEVWVTAINVGNGRIKVETSLFTWPPEELIANVVDPDYSVWKISHSFIDSGLSAIEGEFLFAKYYSYPHLIIRPILILGDIGPGDSVTLYDYFLVTTPFRGLYSASFKNTPCGISAEIRYE
jgi:hypothetical protein